MKKKYIKELSDLYTDGVLNENTAVWKKGECPADALGDNKNAKETIKNSGPNVPGLEKPNDMSDKEGADEKGTKKFSQEKQKEKEKKENLNERSINNCTMSKPNIFDKLYATIMEAEDLEDLDNLEMGDDSSPEDDLEELGVEDELGGDEITLSLPRDLAEKLHEALMSQLGGDEDEGDEFDDLGDDDGDSLDFGDDDPLMQEGGEIKYGQKNDGKPEGQAENHGDGKQPSKNRVQGRAGSVGGGSQGSGDSSGMVDGGKPKSQSENHGDGKQPTSNKVNAGGYQQGEFIK